MMKKYILWVALALVGFNTSSFAQTKRVKDNTVTLYITRHGKTILNTVDRVQGWSDSFRKSRGLVQVGVDSCLTPAGVDVAEYL